MPDQSIREFRIRTLTGVTREPVQETKLAELIQAGKLGPADEAQRMGSQRWRTMQELAPHFFRGKAATEPNVVSIEPVTEVVQDTRSSASAVTPPLPVSRNGGAIPAVGGFTVSAWIFIVLAGLELLPWLYAIFATSKLKVQGNFASNWIPIGTLIPVPPSLLLGMSVHAVFGTLFVMLQPFLMLSVIPGAIMSTKLLRFMPEESRPFHVSGVWWRWLIWIGSPVGALLVLRVTAPTNAVIPALIGAASSGVIVLFGLFLTKIAQRLRKEFDARTGAQLLPLGVIAGWAIVAAAGVRALLYLYMGYGIYMIESGSEVAGPSLADLGWLKSFVDIAQVGAIALMVAWAVELVLRLPRIASEAR